MKFQVMLCTGLSDTSAAPFLTMIFMQYDVAAFYSWNILEECFTLLTEKNS
jgi:hypothetical protein